MIELVSSQYDDAAFLELVQRIVNGAVTELRAPEVYLVHVDNWFDHKWLGWWSSWKYKETQKLYVPPFNPNRVRSQKRLTWDAKKSCWTPAGQGKPLHRRQPGRRNSYGQKLDRVAKFAAFIWYSGNTVANLAGSMMLYLSGTEAYAWYASFSKGTVWKINDGFRISRRELESFEECGRQMELVVTKP